MIANFRALVDEPLTTLKRDIAELDGNAKEWLDPIARQFRMQESKRLETRVEKLLSNASHATEKMEFIYEKVQSKWPCFDN